MEQSMEKRDGKNTFKDHTGFNDINSGRDKYRKEILLSFLEFLVNVTDNTEFNEPFLEIYRDLTSDKFKLAVFAEVSKGKSTTINAILGEEILKKGTGEATTRTITILTKPTQGKKHKAVFIEYKSKENITKIVAESCGETFDREVADDLDNKTERDKIASIIEGFNDRKKAAFINCILNGWENHRPLMGTEKASTLKESDSLVHDEKTAVFIKRRVIHYSNEFLNLGIDIVDTPGLGSVNERHDSETENFARNEADAALFITCPKQLISNNLKDFLKNKITVDDIPGKGFFLINQIGDLKLDELKQDYGDHDGLKDKLRYILNTELELNLEHDRIETCDALLGLHSKIIAEKQKKGSLSKNDREIWDEQAMIDKKAEFPSPLKNLDFSRFMMFEKSLMKTREVALYSYYNKILTGIKELNNRLEKEKNNILEKREELLKRRKKLPSVKEDMYLSIKTVLDNVESNISSVFNHLQNQLADFVNKFKEAIIAEQSSEMVNIKSQAEMDFKDILTSFNENHDLLWNSVRNELSQQILKQGEGLLNENVFDVCFSTTEISETDRNNLIYDISGIFDQLNSFWDLLLFKDSVKKKRSERFGIHIRKNIESQLISQVQKMEEIKKSNLRLRLYKVLSIEISKLNNEIDSLTNDKRCNEKEIERKMKIEEILCLTVKTENDLKVIAPIFKF